MMKGRMMGAMVRILERRGRSASWGRVSVLDCGGREARRKYSYPATFEEIILKDTEVPVKTILEHLKAECRESDLFKTDPEAIYREILKKSAAPPK